MRTTTLRLLLGVLSLTLMAAMGAGCASGPRLHTETSTSGIRAAEEVGAAKVPQASLHLQLAKEELKLAEGLAAKGEHEQAASMVLRAEADAELAVALSRGDAEAQKAEEAVTRARQLRQDNPYPNEGTNP